jgi:predicted nuclease of predicted toxin-antitoxin system
MKFVVDAQLPKRLVLHLRQLNFEARHTSGLELGNRTPDVQVARFADIEGAILVTKDTDFINSHILKGSPKRLLLVSTGNTSNKILLKLFDQHTEAIVSALAQSNLVELNETGLVIHGD